MILLTRGTVLQSISGGGYEPHCINVYIQAKIIAANLM